MVYLAKAMCKANEQLAPSAALDQEGLLESTEDVTTVAEAAVALGLASVVPVEQQLPLAEFLAELPPAIDAAMVAAARNAVERGVRVTFTWQPGYAYELRIWDVSDGEDGMVNLHLVSPHPVEAQPQS
jgi:hypothetical protein